ncbi:hypothetical protein JCM10449v2_008139 [Rhodotorula kratochvilovae]
MSSVAMPTDAAAAAAAAEQLALFQFAIHDIVTPTVIAAFIACLLYGVLLFMAATYFTRFGSTDRLAFKLLVGFLTVSALADTMVDCAWAWLYTVKSFTDSNVLALFPWTFVAYAVLTGPNVLLTQGFFTWRVWIVSNRKNWWLPAIMLVLQLTACAMCWYLAHWINQATYMTEFGEVKWLLYTWLSSGFACDVLITGGITYYLVIRPQRLAGSAAKAKISRSYIPRIAHRSNPLGRIVIKTFQTNTASLIIQAVTLIVMINKGRTVWYSVTGFQESKIYIISVIATLNARHDSTSGDSAHFTHDLNGTSRAGTSVKGRSAAFSRNGQASVPVHITISEEVKIDEGASEFSKDLTLSPVSPYSVRFESAHTSDSGDVELGRKAGYEEKY